jgi:alpha-beta hydrolase superfamily lysophospholipase
MSQADMTFRSHDGTRLAGTLHSARDATRSAILVHGGGVTRDEGGFYVRLADALAAGGIASLRFDLRGHGTSGGRQEELTLAAAANDVRAAIDEVHASGAPVTVIGTSFSGGVCALVAARTPGLRSLVLFNPLLDYKRRFVDEKPYWSSDRIDPEFADQLDRRGYIEHSPTFRLGRALLNEVFQLSTLDALSRITVPTLLVHGTKDTFINIESSRRPRSGRRW